jgi:aminoglycoside phosphotransferase (APT) family kinase protein
VRGLRSVDEVTPEWCSAALSRRVSTVAASALGTGQMADTYRLRLGYQTPDTGPPTCVVKLPAGSPASRTAAKVTRAYEVEARFYRDLAPGLPVHVPRCYACCYEEPSGAFTLLLEDVGAGRVPDQVEGCTPGEVDRAVDQLAALHGPRWGDPALATLGWLPRHDGPDAGWMASLVRRVYPRFLRRFGDRLSPEVVDLLDVFVPKVEQYLKNRPGLRTVVHGDFRADNLVVGPDRITVLDWQTAAHEPAITDLSYFLGASVDVTQRRATEQSVVRHYVGALREYGVTLSVDDCWRDYRRYALGGLLMSIVGSTLVVRTDRGDDMFATMTNRHGAHAVDLDASSFIR